MGQQRRTVAAVTLLVLIGAGSVGVRYNRGGLGELSHLFVSSPEQCSSGGGGRVEATIRYSGRVSGGSLAIGLDVGVEIETGDGPVTLGETTEYVRVSGTFDETTTITVDVDEGESRSGVVQCFFGVADTGWHVPWS